MKKNFLAIFLAIATLTSLLDEEKKKNGKDFPLFKESLQHWFHEFRYTFITRAKECDCNPETVMLWVGHEFGLGIKTSRVDRGYTTFSDEYFLKEINKIDYEL